MKTILVTAALIFTSQLLVMPVSAAASVFSPVKTRKSVSLPKSRFKSDSAAAREAERRYPKCKVTNVKELSTSWLVTMECDT